MSIERISPLTTPGSVTCINAFWAYARGRGFFDLPDWTVPQVEALLAQGSHAWVYRNGGGRVDGVCIYDAHADWHPPGQLPALWMNVQILAVRADILNTTPLRMRATFACANGAITEGLRPTAAVGLTCQFEKGNTDLRALTDSFPGVIYEETDKVSRAWFARGPFLTRFDQWLQSTSAATEPIIP